MGDALVGIGEKEREERKEKLECDGRPDQVRILSRLVV